MPLDIILTLQDLIAVATEQIEHLWQGDCPGVDTTQLHRDPECPACQVLLKAEALLLAQAENRS